MERFSRRVDESLYHVKDAMYREGYLKQFGEYPLFIFIAVSETINCGRYPVRVFQLETEDFEAFKEAAIKAKNQAELDKAYRYAARALAEPDGLLSYSTDIYELRSEDFTIDN